MDYLKYYWLEKYLFDNVNKNFHNRGCLTAEEFFAIVIWKRNASKTKIINGIKGDGRTISEITLKISEAKTREQRLDALLSPKIPGIGIAIASAILTVCYPDDFTITDYRACASLKNFGEEVIGNPATKISSYFEYLDKCKKLAYTHNLSLRDFDRVLWAKSWYEDLQRFLNGTIAVFLHGTVIMHENALEQTRDERVRQSREREESVLDYIHCVPVGNAVEKLRTWEKHMKIVYISSHEVAGDVKKDKAVLKRYGFPEGDVLFRENGRKYKDIVEKLMPDVLIEDDCESIGGEADMAYQKVRPEIKRRIKSIVVKEFGGIDHLPDDIGALKSL